MPTVTYGTCSPTTADGQLSTLQKILQCGAGGGAGSGATHRGAGPPAASLGNDGETYWDETNKDFYVKDLGTWQILVDLT